MLESGSGNNDDNSLILGAFSIIEKALETGRALDLVMPINNDEDYYDGNFPYTSISDLFESSGSGEKKS